MPKSHCYLPTGDEWEQSVTSLTRAALKFELLCTVSRKAVSCDKVDKEVQ